MGGAMFAGWCKAGLAPSVLVDPHAPPGIARPQDHLVGSLDELPGGFQPSAAILAIKPQMAADLLPALGRVLPPGAVVLSILAGKTLANITAGLGTANPVVRAMPNTPAAIGEGMTVACADSRASESQKQLCNQLLEAVGEVAWLPDEMLIDRITAISGSGPAYVFLLAEILEQAGIEQGIPPDLAKRLARQTVSGAGALIASSHEDTAELRRAVTSAKGVTEQALLVLMDEAAWPRTVRAALLAAVKRAGELAG